MNKFCNAQVQINLGTTDKFYFVEDGISAIFRAISQIHDITLIEPVTLNLYQIHEVRAGAEPVYVSCVIQTWSVTDT